MVYCSILLLFVYRILTTDKRETDMDVNTAYGNTGNIKNHGENVELQNLQRHHNSDQQVALNERSTVD